MEIRGLMRERLWDAAEYGLMMKGFRIEHFLEDAYEMFESLAKVKDLAKGGGRQWPSIESWCLPIGEHYTT
jgi:hypothetical protein